MKILTRRGVIMKTGPSLATLTQWGRSKMTVIFQTTSSNAFSWRVSHNQGYHSFALVVKNENLSMAQKQLDMEEYRFLCMKPKYCWVIFDIHWVITFWRSPKWQEISALWMLHNVDLTYIFNGSHLIIILMKLLSYVSIHTYVCIKPYIDEFKWKKSSEVAQQKCML